MHNLIRRIILSRLPEGPTLQVQGERIIIVDYCNASLDMHLELDVQHGYSFNETIFVHPRLRGQGYGRALVEAREELAGELGLTVLINKNRNPDFWRYMGYEKLGRIRQMYLGNKLGIGFQPHSMYKDLR
ncbi:GNAT family N-acetyltransferase [Candidatus Woesearchaeota archaeon]|nr:GNAT family N-acetyltransferase [Candidatus Woesearchaeota archaeon]